MPHFETPHIHRMDDPAFSRTFFRLRAQNLTGVICGAIMLFVSRQSGSMPSNYVSICVPSRSLSSSSCTCRLASSRAACWCCAAAASLTRASPPSALLLLSIISRLIHHPHLQLCALLQLPV
jgi:hypothetical protein